MLFRGVLVALAIVIVGYLAGVTFAAYLVSHLQLPL